MNTFDGFSFALGQWSIVVFAGLCIGLAKLVGRKQDVVEGVEDMEQIEQLSMIEALERRDAVLDSIDDRHQGWTRLALDAFHAMPREWSGIGEDLRFALTENGVPAPRAPQAWGVFIGLLVKRGLLVATGERRPMRAPGANGRKSDVYRRVVAMEAAE